MKFYIARLRKNLVLLFAVLLTAAGASAQEFRFTAQVNTNVIAQDEYVQVQFTLINPTNLSEFKAPAFKGFEVVQGPSQQQGMSNDNGRVTTYYAFSYTLAPTAPGNFTIPGATARVDGRTVRSNPVSIEVTKAGTPVKPQAQQPAQPNYPQRRYPGEAHPGVLRPGDDVKEQLRKNVFVRVEVDKTNVFEGEQITATYKLYTRLPTNSSVTKVPAFKGFSAKDMDIPNPPRPTEEMVNGVPFNVFVIRKTLLFPLQSGELELDPAEVDNQVHFVKVGGSGQRRRAQTNDPFQDLFADDFFFEQPEAEIVPYRIQSPVVKVQVKPLPAEGRPASFNGAVGQFTMNASLDKEQLSTDDALSLKVAISGRGNVNLLNAPPLDIPAAFEKYDPTVTDNIEKNSNPLSGSRTFQYALMPQQKGDYNLKPVEFSYFDPAAKAYKTITSAPFSVHVVQGKEVKKEKADFGGQTDLAGIRTSSAKWSKQRPFFFGKPLFWVLFLLPVLAIAGAAYYRRREQYNTNNAALLRHRHANKVALKRLELAARYLKEGKDKAFYEETSRALWGYLSHKLRIPMAEMSKQRVDEKLTKLRLSDAAKEKLFALADRCERALYAPGDSVELRQGAYQEAVEVITNIENEIKGRA
ncbi:BatD family protein [Chitinophaga rhizosphaerae]|uniref:BatD family protein n=1 Tax=Chitinophaga rhizosphaerae TaxID=1864947 RepID=UPI000F7FD5A5|nr:BatD family protein [Chitinophaga rhizosphaerae]